MKRKKSSSELAILFPKWNGSRELYIPCRVHSTCRISTIWFDTLTRLYIVHLTRFYFDKQIVLWGMEGRMTFRCSFFYFLLHKRRCVGQFESLQNKKTGMKGIWRQAGQHQNHGEMGMYTHFFFKGVSHILLLNSSKRKIQRNKTKNIIFFPPFFSYPLEKGDDVSSWKCIWIIISESSLHLKLLAWHKKKGFKVYLTVGGRIGPLKSEHTHKSQRRQML